MSELVLVLSWGSRLYSQLGGHIQFQMKDYSDIIPSLALFSSARRVEVFAATSAFAAVQVVYVGLQ